MHAIRLRSLVFVSALMVLVAGGCWGKSNGPTPPKELSQLTTQAIHSWLSPRMEQDSWLKFSSPSAAWRQAPSTEALSTWFRESLGSDWDLDSQLEDIRKTELFKRLKPAEHEFVSSVKAALETFRFEGR